jgi:hypothetical protein
MLKWLHVNTLKEGKSIKTRRKVLQGPHGVAKMQSVEISQCLNLPMKWINNTLQELSNSAKLTSVEHAA